MRYQTGLSLLFLALFLTQCYQKVCPAYSSAFLPSKEVQVAYFSYFNSDSTIKETELTASVKTTWYGRAKEPYVFPLARPFVRDVYGINDGFHKVISTKPFFYPTAADSTLEELGFDKVTIKEETLEEFLTDTVEVEEEAPGVDSAYYGYDQYYYELQFGKQLDSFNSFEFVDTVIRFRDRPDTIPASDSVILIKRKWYQFFKPNYKPKRILFPEPDAPEVDSLNLDYLNENLFDTTDVGEVQEVMEPKPVKKRTKKPKKAKKAKEPKRKESDVEEEPVAEDW